MPVKCLTTVVYEASGWDWHLEKTFNRGWEQIVTAIDRLDMFRFLWVWLFIGKEEATVDCLTIMGGDVYWLGLAAGKYEQLRSLDPGNGSHEVQVWTSDQGFANQ